MSRKNITAIVVLAEFPHGENPYGAANWGKVKEAGTRLHEIIRDVDPQALQMHRKGSAGLISFMNKDEYQSCRCITISLDRIRRPDKSAAKHMPKGSLIIGAWMGAFRVAICAARKGGWVTLTTGIHAGRKVWVDGPEYETAAGFGANLGMWHPEFIMEANWYCDNYGMDTISTSVIMAFVMECYQRGYLIREDTDGFELTWGDEQAALQFIHDLAYRKTDLVGAAGRGMVELAAWVSEKYTARTGRPKPVKELQQFAMQTKGLPFSLYRTHRSLSMQASYAAASDIGAHHAAAWLVKVDLLGAFPRKQRRRRSLRIRACVWEMIIWGCVSFPGWMFLI